MPEKLQVPLSIRRRVEALDQSRETLIWCRDNLNERSERIHELERLPLDPAAAASLERMKAEYARDTDAYMRVVADWLRRNEALRSTCRVLSAVAVRTHRGPRPRGAGRPRVRRGACRRSSARSGDSDDDGPAWFEEFDPDYPEWYCRACNSLWSEVCGDLVCPGCGAPR